MASASDNLHISAPHLLSKRRRLGDAFATGVMWLLYSYLWAPFISLVAWLLGFEFAYDVMVRAGGIRALREVLWWYGLVIASIFTVVATWSLLNRQRFTDHNRRRSGRAVGDLELVKHFAIKPDELLNLRGARILRISLSEQGAIEQVEDLPPETLSETDAVERTGHR